MSDYGSPPQDPNTPQNPYGQPNPYGQQPAYGQPAQGVAPDYASWFKRVGAYLIDGLLVSVAGFPMWIGQGMLAASTETVTSPDGTVTTTTDGGGAALLLIVLGLLMSLAFFIWNTCLKQGRTGYSIGKGALGTKLIGEQTGQPIGAGMSFVRYLAHILDALPCYLGYLWPLWDAKRQTFADKIMKTVVINQPKA
ncbi:MAG: RDD family protein [Aeromicrobium sp.]